jgi:cytochrome c553
MKRSSLKIAILLTLGSLGSIAPASAWEGGNSVRNCTWCHGPSAQGYMTAPRLAGQRPLYLESQIKSFREHTRDAPFSKQYMWGAVAALGPQDARALAAYFAALPPRPADDGDRNAAARGRTIYLEGMPEANIAACYACHGPNGEGVREIPRLGGLSYGYLKTRLAQWGQGYHSGGDSPMPIVARQLGPNEIEALASYLSFVK